MRENFLSKLSKYLFWDYDIYKLDPDVDRKLILERVFSRGTESDEMAAFGYYEEDAIKRAVVEIKYLDKKTLNYLSVILNVQREKFKCYKNSLSKNPFGVF